jgi:hypothetical protein
MGTVGAEHGLFRQQVIDHASGKLYGDVLVRPAVTHVVITLLFAALCIAILYLASTLEWTRKASIAGVFEEAAGHDVPMKAALYVPASLRSKIEIGRTFYVSIDGLHDQAWTTITIRSISGQVLAKCPICNPAEAGAEPYVRVEAIALDPMIRLDREWLALTPHIQFHFDLKLGKETAWKMFARRLHSGHDA